MGDEKSLYQLEMESNTLSLKVDDNRPRALPTANQNAVNLNEGTTFEAFC